MQWHGKITILSSYKEASIYRDLRGSKTSCQHQVRSCGNNSNSSNSISSNNSNSINNSSRKAKIQVCLVDSSNRVSRYSICSPQAPSSKLHNKGIPTARNKACRPNNRLRWSMPLTLVHLCNHQTLRHRAWPKYNQSTVPNNNISRDSNSRLHTGGAN